MVEYQIVKKILNTGSIEGLEKYKLNVKDFTMYQQEISFIMDHFSKYGNVPNKETFQAHFPDYIQGESDESWEYLAGTFKEQNVFREAKRLLETSAKNITENSIEGLDNLIQQAMELQEKMITTQQGHDIVKNVDERIEDYKNREGTDGIIGTPIGLEGLDEAMGGLLPGEDLIIILGRPNEGKSWVGQLFGVGAWKNGKRVLHYSGEMSSTMVGYRFDTLNKNFSNSQLTTGALANKDEYFKYGEELQSNPEKESYIVITPSMLGGEQLDIPVLDRLIRQHKPEVVVVDQLTLMDDYRARSGDGHHIRLGHIAQDLFKLSEKYGIPIVAPHQANRSAENTKDDEAAPGLGDAYGSDGVEQNATRVIGIKQVPQGIKMFLAKNRYGQNDLEFIYHWDIDRGIFETQAMVYGEPDDDTTTNFDDVGGLFEGRGEAFF